MGGGGSRGAVISLVRYTSSHFNSSQPSHLTPGPLLGITLDKPPATLEGLKSDLIGCDHGGKVMQMVTWEGGHNPHKVGSELPEPLLTSWDPGHQYLALAYSSQVVFCICHKSPASPSPPSSADPLSALSQVVQDQGQGHGSSGGLGVHGSPLPLTDGPVVNMGQSPS